MKSQQFLKSVPVLLMGGLILSALLASGCGSAVSNSDPTITSTTELPSERTNTTTLWVPDIVDALAPSIVNITVHRAEGLGTGTGVVFDSSGTIITNWHVVEEADSIDATLHSGQSFPAALVRENQALDLAILQIDASDLHPAKFGDSELLRVGEDVVAIGHAFGLSGGPSVSRGVVSALNRTVADSAGQVFNGLIQTDATINLGSSGGALVNSYGEVVGINVGTIDVGQGANFALDVNTVIEGANHLIALGEREQPGYLGVGGIDVNPYIAFQQSLPVREGFGVRYVDPDSPAAASIKIDDIIVGIDDVPIRNRTDFTEFLRTHPRGTDVVVTTVRGTGENASIMEIPVTLGAPDT